MYNILALAIKIQIENMVVFSEFHAQLHSQFNLNGEFF